MSKIIKRSLLIILLIIIAVLIYNVSGIIKKEGKSKFIGTAYATESVDMIEISCEGNTRVYKDADDIKMIMSNLKSVELSYIKDQDDINGWIYDLKIYVGNKVVDTVLVHNYRVTYNQKNYRSDKNIVTILDNLLNNKIDNNQKLRQLRWEKINRQRINNVFAGECLQ